MSIDERLLRVSGLAAGYGGPPVLRDISFAAQSGQRIGVLGPNGGGKSTLFKVLLGDLEPSRGSLEQSQRPAYVPQTERSRLDYPVSALDVALMGTLSRMPWWRRPTRQDRREALEALSLVGLGSLAHVRFGELSGGQRQRTLIARALVQDAPLLLLDEPFAGVDEPSSDLLISLVDELAGQGRALMIATHDVDQVRAWDLVLCLNQRQVAFGPPADVLTRPVLEAAYGGEIVMLPEADGSDGREGLLPAHHHDHEH